MCRQETDVPTGYEIFRCTCELQVGCAHRRRVCRQERGVPTGEGCSNRREFCRKETEVPTGDESLYELKAG